VIFVVENDAQDGPDHVDAHRSPGYVISAYTKRNSVVHTFYNTLNMIRTLEDLLGMNHLGMNDANSEPMADVFTTEPNLSPYTALLPGAYTPLPPKVTNRSLASEADPQANPSMRVALLVQAAIAKTGYQ